MLGALKRRWKPKRGSADGENSPKKSGRSKTDAMNAVAASQRQIHPCEGKTQLIAYNECEADVMMSTPKATPTAIKRSPADPLPKQPPNICLEGGRVEFVRLPPEDYPASPVSSVKSFSKAACDGAAMHSVSPVYQPLADFQENWQTYYYADKEKCDIAKETLEARIRDLERLLESEQKSVQRERMAVARLQRQLARKEVSHRDAERERRLRADTEDKFREAIGETERYRTSLASLQRDFNRMEETVRNMLQFKTRCEYLGKEKASLTAAYEDRIQQFQGKIKKLGQENESLKHQLRLLQASSIESSAGSLIERLRTVEAENASLCRDSELQRRQYERCLDDIANQVVRALLSQKGLREEIGNLQRRIKELESQNQALANILVNRLGSMENGWINGLSPKTDCLDSPTNNERRRWFKTNAVETMLMLPVQRPKTLNLRPCAQPLTARKSTNERHSSCRRNKPTLVIPPKPVEDEGNESPESGNRDEGYSTMSSDIQGPTENSEISRVGLEELKELKEDAEDLSNDSDTIFLPLSFNPRHSFPSNTDRIPFKKIVRSFSDSHLCLHFGSSSFLLRRSRGTALLRSDSLWDQEWMEKFEVDRNELENWSLSSEDIPPSGLPSIQEDNWSSSSSVSDVDVVNAIGIDFTRDFYRLVKFESTKSLASNGNDLSADKEINFQSVLNFIAEQQQYVHDREVEITSKDASTMVSEEMVDSNDAEDKIQRTENFTKCLDNFIPVIDEEEEEEEPGNAKEVTAKSPKQSSIPVSTKTRIPVIKSRLTGTPPPTPKKTSTKKTCIPQPLNRRISEEASDVLVRGSFNENASTKDVIDELNRLIRKGDDVEKTPVSPEQLDLECGRPTGWVHVEKDIDFNDPKARANLLDVMLASSESSESGSESDNANYQRLHRLHRFRRQKKAHVVREPNKVLRIVSFKRPTILSSSKLFVRFGDKERDALSSFDFLDEFLHFSS